MENEALFMLVIGIVAFLVFLLLLAIARKIFRATKISFARLLASSFYLAIAMLVIGYILNHFIMGWLLSHGDPGPGGYLLALIYGILPFIAATFLVGISMLYLAPVTRGQRLGISAFTAVLFPVVYLGLAYSYLQLAPRVDQYIIDTRREALTIRGEQAASLMKQYGLPHVDGASFRQFSRSAKDEEYYSAAFNPNASCYGTHIVPWREWTEQIADQVETGLKSAGYEVVRSAGPSQKYWPREGEIELAPIIIEGTRDNAFAYYIINYNPTEGCASPRCNVMFGEPRYRAKLQQSLSMY